jgi:sarcosine oxidase subunit gamma
MAEPRFESPLAHVVEPTGLAVAMREMTGRGMLDLRGPANDQNFMEKVKDALGVALPTTPRSSSSWGDIKVLWLSVDQWLVLCPAGKTAELLAALRQVLDGIHSMVVDVSDMRAVIRLEGEGSREVLMKGCSLDLLDGSYTTGVVRRMRYAEIAALLHVVDHDVFDVYVFRSYADHAWNFLLATAREPARVRLFGKQAAPV